MSQKKFIDPKIKTKLIPKISQILLTYSPYQEATIHPTIHQGLNPELLEIRKEIYNLAKLRLQERREKLWKLLISDYLYEDKELRQVDYAYINTQP